jgi:hypothetical protein
MTKKTTKQEVRNPLDAGNFYDGVLSVPADIKKDCKERNLELRWGRVSQFKQYGFHKTSWQPYLRPKSAEPSLMEKLGGKHPDGFVIVNDAILMVKPSADVKAHKENLKAKARRIVDPVADARRKIQNRLREEGLESSAIDEGYEDTRKLAEVGYEDVGDDE